MRVLPAPSLPAFPLVPKVLVPALVISIIAFSITISMASIFARKLNYEIDGTQELLASGVSNIFGSFFMCLPFAASLSRSLIQEDVGGKTQIASIISCLFLLLVLLWIGPFFEPLPNCVLAGIVLVSLKGMFVQIKDVFSIWHRSKMDGLVWLLTFFGVVVIDIDIGLAIGIALSILTVVMLGQKVKIFVFGNIPGTDIYLDVSRYKAVSS
ncbi:hypothetical protein J437_LFUL018567 [Ladona fulva]|uniref:SLC26A/SulP transporter domain-containing protein n=1 Tax=Ladona fulva TaxID=123851 RepID=A0A8K0KUH8_LADFU|nr:hypothetical protein J437_LFUL018567 [Ladona fulva]